MPPKKRVPAAKAKSKATAKKPAAPSVPPTSAPVLVGINEAVSSAQGPRSGGLGSSGSKRAADSPQRDVASIKKAKVTVGGEVEDSPNRGKEDEESSSLLSDEDFDKLSKLEEMLSSHIPGTIRKMFKGIKYEKPVPDGVSLAEIIDLLIDELKSRILSGKGISSELDVVYDVDDKWHDGEYDDEDDNDYGLPKDVQKRLNDAESMLQYMAGGALKSIMRQLNPYTRGAGTNRGMAGMIMAILEDLAKDGSNIKREYMIVKSFGTACCGNNSDPDLNFASDADEDDD